MQDLINGHHIDCRMQSYFSTNPDKNVRKTLLHQFDKKTNKWSDKLQVQNMAATSKCFFNELEENFCKAENLFHNSRLIENINKYKTYPITDNIDNIDNNGYTNKQILATYISMLLCRNPENINSMMIRNKLDIEDKKLKNLSIDKIIKILSQIFWGTFNNIQYYTLTTDNLLSCSDNIIFSVHRKNIPYIRYHIMPITHDKYLIGAMYDDGYCIKPNSLSRLYSNIFSVKNINDFGYISNSRFIYSDEKLSFTTNNDYIVNDFILKENGA